MYKPSDSSDAAPAEGRLEVTLDGLPITLPPDRRSMAGIRSYLEMVALEQQRILGSVSVDGELVDLNRPFPEPQGYCRIEGETLDLDRMPLQLIRTALEETAKVRGHAFSAVSLVMINDFSMGRELWWTLARELKQPLLALSLIPETAWGGARGSASLRQLRKWQLQQLGAIISDVDEAAGLNDPSALSNAIEHRVLPWLEGIRATLDLWHETLQAGQATA